METISLLQLVQATSGLAGRNNTQFFIDGKPIIEIRITVKDGKPQVNLISASNADEDNAEPEPEPYPVQCDFDSEKQPVDLYNFYAGKGQKCACRNL